ncbi:MAG TPA: hypothetical protein VGV12_01125 [Gemmatimonadales bacterium]|nr:hypothetical protein [Gemmatimonadales bacterium]
MMSSESSRIRETLQDYVAGRLKAERLVITIATAYYGRNDTPGTRDGLGPLIEIIDRASPGIVELGGVGGGGQGFDIRLAERSFPQQHEQELRRAVEAYLESHRTTGVISTPPAQAPAPGVLARIVGAIQRLLSPSA